MKEFGGARGAIAIILGSHFLVYYLRGSIAYHDGALYDPRLLWDHLRQGAIFTWSAAAIYGGFVTIQLLFAYLMPGVWVRGLAVPTEGGIQHRYLCNGASSWYATLALLVLFRKEVAGLVGSMGSILTVAVIAADVIAIFAYVLPKHRTRTTGDAIYDFFAGVVLNPRVGRVDLKFFAELRISWILLFTLTFAAAMKEVELRGALSLPMMFMLTAHGLYTNACMKGEECVPTTWDVFHEKWGWMLIFWNLVGVPFVYSFNSFYLLVASPEPPPTWFMALLFAVLFAAYYVWDTSQSQRNRFRMMQRGTYVKRYTFPQLPWGTLSNPEYMTTARRRHLARGRMVALRAQDPLHGRHRHGVLLGTGLRLQRRSPVSISRILPRHDPSPRRPRRSALSGKVRRRLGTLSGTSAGSILPVDSARSPNAASFTLSREARLGYSRQAAGFRKDRNLP